ncbi:uncharacterized protein TNCV_1569581 [Trichonephila clavipes]|uniref:Transposase n=1 Tax=Trichonephila clavipes TaxID=2585209 RepID=A0A8X6VNN0_TRICX|nr:uncharacterized protein TNCV_1569581 [Trichonephila clavipes]
MLSLRDGNAIETLLMTAQINTDLVNHPVPLTTEPSTSLVHFETDACKSIINSILRYKDYHSHKNAQKDFQGRFVDNRSFYDRFRFRDDFRTSVAEHKNILQNILPEINLEDTLNCQVIYSQFGLAIHQNDHQARRRFIEWAQNEIAVVPDFHKRILFSDEAHFWLNGYVNKQNCRIWNEANPQVYVETPLLPEKLTVWCALWTGGILLQK